MPPLLPTAHRPAPRAVPAAQLLADFVATPVGMKPAPHLALLHSLHHQSQSGPAAPPVEALFGSDASAPLPWEAPLWSLDPATGIALLEVTGPLVKGYDSFTCWYYQLASIDRLTLAVDELARQPGLRALVVVLNTPGGVTTGMPELCGRLTALAARLPVVCYTSDTAASNGMRIALSGTLFLPTASAIVGCIGTYIALYDYTAQLAQLGIKLELYRAGTFKGIGLAGKTTTTEEAAFLQAEVERANTIFQDFVRARRPAAPEALRGQWYDGAQAVAYGLADATVSGLDEVLALLAPASAAPAI